jgi:hypothetical protein
MATIKEPYKEKHDCSFCSESIATASWNLDMENPIYLCSGCAQDKLPAFIADAVLSYSHHRGNLDLAWQRIQTAFWRGLALAIRNEEKRTTACTTTGKGGEEN